MSQKLKAGIVGGTGMVGQRFIQLLDGHPWFEVTSIAASSNSAGKTYEESVQGRWKLDTPIPEHVKSIIVQDAAQVEQVAADVDFVFCAVDMKKNEIQALEEAYAKTGTPVISNNSAHRWTADVPMVIPEINPGHIDVIAAQRKRLGTSTGFIAVKPNCSIQSYVPALHALLDYKPTNVVASTYQAISGAGKNFTDWPEMLDNVIPYIGGEEEKSEQEPLRIWGSVVDGEIVKAASPIITTQCIRVPVADGHLATVFASFENKPPKDEILDRWLKFKGRPQELELPSAPKQFITYFEEENRPQTKLDRDIERGMGVSVGRLREDSIYDYKFVGLSHNTLRGAAGGAVLIAELLKADGYIVAK
ncbi:aspartate-semialdehyde dehydrogenase [Paenibacillus solani]|nr:aspartate-semialdehyde dehydrogenase [Paenibacillus solani]